MQVGSECMLFMINGEKRHFQNSEFRTMAENVIIVGIQRCAANATVEISV